MATKTVTSFKEKEGKFYAPILYEAGNKYRAGVKGVYAEVRITLPSEVAGQKSELFALNTEMFISHR